MPDFSFETVHGRSQGRILCGVDEVGRGPLAGPVIAAAAIIPADINPDLLAGVRDSKKLSTKQREALFDPLCAACPHAIAEASVAEINQINILWASMLAMNRAIIALPQPVDLALIDGNRIPKDLPCPAIPIVKGDDKSLSIAVASIIAKVTRDRLMTRLAGEHPHYGWERNAGYGTAEHLRAIDQHGITVWHRDSFAPIAKRKLVS